MSEVTARISASKLKRNALLQPLLFPKGNVNGKYLKYEKKAISQLLMIKGKPRRYFIFFNFESFRKQSAFSVVNFGSGAEIKPISEFDNGIYLMRLLEYEIMAISQALSKIERH